MFVGLAVIMALVLFLPFSVKLVEEELEAFLFIMGAAAMTVSHAWSWHVVKESLAEPVKISLAVLVIGLIFKAGRNLVQDAVKFLKARLGIRNALFLMVMFLGFASSVLTAIIAALILCEIVTCLNLDRKSEARVTVYACYAIGFGAALTPIGEPLSTIVTAKLSGPPHNADFFYLSRLLTVWVTPAILAVSWLAAYGHHTNKGQGGDTLRQDDIEDTKHVALRAAKVYLFVMALVYLGTGLSPLAEKAVASLKDWQLYWLGTASAVLDNATLAAAEIVPSMTRNQILSILLSLLISGGMLIPGNIPNIISAAKLDIKSREWARVALLPGLAFLTIYFIGLLIAH
ncbi:MAG: hypothetical protein A2X28_07830 [Elusimicrobia bacterium GWA2_56_46]|nr:MAG: hypothetical protein A2X28_07830 [Elusimicrobia bacterium GWA2_56_46]OGR53892.1 MAG: hypothetical protein A2X39_06600 [Elusimicrobia bacterium GWC2_56_31]HBB65883.1 cation transporter [Elusimicrobiota bacterium]HBW22627.1 cation transporter [Elusimicrobiota bacterium]